MNTCSRTFVGSVLCFVLTRAASAAKKVAKEPQGLTTCPKIFSRQLARIHNIIQKNKMAQTVRDSFLDLERHRQLLEENIEKLRKSLRHWQTWEAEYEGLKEEILAVNPTPDRDQLSALGREYEGELVNRKEVEELLGPNTRSAVQVVNLLDRRIDYVEQNVKSVQKQIESAQNKLLAASVISTPDVRNEDGLPLTEITETLDDDGNVISSHVSTPGSAKPQLLEVLQKAGVQTTLSPSSDPEAINQVEKSILPTSAKSAHPTPEAIKSAKKGVNFTEDTKSEPEIEKSDTALRLEKIMSLAKQSEATRSEPPIIPESESPEDAALRSQMLEYGMSEVNAVVAELDLEDGSDWSETDYENDASSADDEDEFGRSTGQLVDDELRQRMRELEEKLGVRMMQNVGKKVGEYENAQEGIGRITVNGRDNDGTRNTDYEQDVEKDSSLQSELQTKKKSVRFSEDLDISSENQPPATVSKTSSDRHATAPISDIVERMAPAQQMPAVPEKKASRFKSSRSTASESISVAKAFSQPVPFASTDSTRTVPTGPEGKTLAPRVIERDIPASNSVIEPDQFDPHLLQQEAATEYHRLRNRQIQREGGFMKQDESEILPLTEEEGGPKKMSRFKAARLAKS
jgi:unconventional prefoldin RPB5 interactor 1